MHGVSGVSGAAPVWRVLVEHLHRGRPSLWPGAPVGVIAESVTFDAAREPVREEFFIRGTEQGRQSAGTQMALAQRYGITSPRDGSIFAIDPDIPPAAQRISFEGEYGAWVLDGKRLGNAKEWSWAPWPGRHELKLVAGDGRALQTVRFEVRGASARGASTGRR